MKFQTPGLSVLKFQSTVTTVTTVNICGAGPVSLGFCHFARLSSPLVTPHDFKNWYCVLRRAVATHNRMPCPDKQTSRAASAAPGRLRARLGQTPPLACGPSEKQQGGRPDSNPYPWGCRAPASRRELYTVQETNEFDKGKFPLDGGTSQSPRFSFTTMWGPAPIATPRHTLTATIATANL